MEVSHKQAAQRILEAMPDDVTLEDIMYKLYFCQRIDHGLRELDQSKTVSHAEVKRSLAKWFQSAEP